MTISSAETVLGAYNGVLGTVMYLTLGAVSAHNLLDTAIFAAIGASVGFLTSFLWKRVFKYFNIKND
jgi:biotin transporter BioY